MSKAVMLGVPSVAVSLSLRVYGLSGPEGSATKALRAVMLAC